MRVPKYETISKEEHWSHSKMYQSRIKPTRGLRNLSDPHVKSMSHRIVRRKLKKEMITELGEE